MPTNTHNSTQSRLLPPPLRRLREHVREIRRLAGETHQQVIDTHLASTRELKQLYAIALDQAGVIARIERRLNHQMPGRPAEGLPPSSAKLPKLAATGATGQLESRESQARLTVIVSTYNQDAYIADAIGSILAQQTSFPIHVIVTDDASTDSTLNIVEQYRARRPDLITVLRSERNEWYFTNVLRALALTRSDYFTLLDADDYWIDNQYLQRGFTFLEAHPDFVIYSANCLCEHPDDERTLFIPEETPDGEYSFDDYLQGRAVISQTSGTIFRNVLFSSGIPEVFLDMIGTDQQYSFACDFDRYAIHLEKGRARFENRASGVYRVTGKGMYSGLTSFEKALWEAKCKVDHWRYFGYRYPEFFLREALGWTNVCLEIMNAIAAGIDDDAQVTPERVAEVWQVVQECRAHVV